MNFPTYIAEKFIQKPCLVVDEQTIRGNYIRMIKKALINNVQFRPHFKTHQSHTIGRWLKDEGCSKIAVSSFDMAVYFASDGWNDITITTPVNLLQLDQINRLASEIHLNVVVDNMFSLRQLIKSASSSVRVFVKIDTGSGRCGLHHSMSEEIFAMCRFLEESSNPILEGLLIHSGHTYKADGKDEIVRIYEKDKRILTDLKASLNRFSSHDLVISIGDTPGCSLVEDFSWADEIRPGNFVFYDLFQWQAGSCSADEIACVMACPVIGVYPQRNEVVIYGGAVHFSKDSLLFNDIEVFGLSAYPESNGELKINGQGKLIRLWQEHGLMSFTHEKIRLIKPGDIVFVFPVHSCLTLDAVRNVISSDGKEIQILTS